MSRTKMDGWMEYRVVLGWLVCKNGDKVSWTEENVNSLGSDQGTNWATEPLLAVVVVIYC
jgi:hypothetical protein